MKLKTHHVAATLFAIGVFLATTAWFSINAPAALATCPAGASVSLQYPSNPTTGTQVTTITGVQNVQAATGSTPLPTGMTFEIYTPPNTAAPSVIGQGVRSGNTWVLQWDSRNLPNGGFAMMAIAHYGTNTAYDCASPTVPFNVYNIPSQAPSMTASVVPNGWQGVPGQSAGFNVQAVYTDQYGRKSPLPTGSTIKWVTNAGALSAPDQPSTVLTAGTVPGTYPLNVNVGFQGVGAAAVATIKINPTGTTSGSGSTSGTPSPSASPLPTASGTTSSSGDTPPLTPAQIQQLSTMPTVFRPSAPTNSNPVVPINTLGCVQDKLGSTRFSQISDGNVTATQAEKLQASNCFTGSDRIPARLAPIEPTKITDLPSEPAVIKVDGLKNQTITDSSGKKITAIVVSGSGTPNSSVFIYIFSDPMVLRAQTDSQGKWNYTLENPLKPGHHEVYAVAAKDSANFVRTAAVPVTIAAASPGSQDGSLVIERTLQPSQIAFILAAVAMIGAALFLMLRLIRRRRHSAAVAGTPGAPAQPVMPATVAPVPAAATTPAPEAAPEPEAAPAPTPPTPSAPAPAAPEPPEPHDSQT